MKIYLVRHGEYLLNDMQKAGELSENGIAEIKSLVALLKPLKLPVSNILHSGKTRAEQTARLLEEAFISDEPPQKFCGINPEDIVESVINDVRNWGSDVVLVGHLPFMSRFVSKLLTNDETKEIVIFHTGTMVCLEGDAVSSWAINWVLTPSLLAHD